MTPKTVAIGAALVLVGVLMGLSVPMVEAQRDGHYKFVTVERNSVWRANQTTGKVSWCFAKGAAIVAICSPWGPAAER